MTLARTTLILAAVLITTAHSEKSIPRNTGVHGIDPGETVKIDLGTPASGRHDLDVATIGSANVDFWVYVGKELVDSSKSLLNRLSTSLKDTDGKHVVVIIRNRSKERDTVTIDITPAAAAAEAPSLSAS